MGLPSKENKVLELFFNEPAKHWHFNEIVERAGISQDRANHWLRKFRKENLIKHIKPRTRMPYFMGNNEHYDYWNRKKLYGIKKTLESEVLSRLQSLKRADTIVIFGSFARGDWNTQSDIDVFILGEPEDLEFGTFCKSSGREVQIHAFKSKKDIKKIRSGLMHNVINGYFVKGKVQDLVRVST